MTDRWQDRSACRSLPAATFFPDRREGIRPAQRICAGCSEWRTCLVTSTVGQTIRGASDDGVWGGIGGSGRRALIRALPTCKHDPFETCKSARCAWCSLIREHRVRLDVIAGDRPRSEARAIVSFGPGATHGRRITHARGCRCVPCRFAASTAGQRLTAEGFDPVAWWEWQFAPYGGETSTADWQVLRPRSRADAILARAKAAADAFLSTRDLAATG